MPLAWRSACVAIACAGAAACASHASPAGRPADLFVSTSFVAKRGDAALAAFKPAVAAVETGGECSLTRTQDNGATVVTASYPTRQKSDMVVSLTFDSVEHLVRYNERRGGTKLPPTIGMTDAQRDSVVRDAMNRVRATTITLDWSIDHSTAINRGGGLPTDAVVGTVKAMEDLPLLGPVRARLARVQRLCGV